jgi:hypothetical protein
MADETMHSGTDSGLVRGCSYAQTIVDHTIADQTMLVFFSIVVLPFSFGSVKLGHCPK